MDVFLILLLLLGMNNNGNNGDNTIGNADNTLESLVLILTFFLLREINTNNTPQPRRCRERRRRTNDPFFDTFDDNFDTAETV